MHSFEKDGYVLVENAGKVEGIGNLALESQVRLKFLVHIGGGFEITNAMTEEEELYVRIIKINESDKTYVGLLLGVSMSSDRLQPNMEISFHVNHVFLIKTKEMIAKEKEMFGIFVDKQTVVEEEREEYYKNLEKEEEMKKKREEEEQKKFIEEGGFSFGFDADETEEQKTEEDDNNISGEKRKREDEETQETEPPTKKRKVE